MRPTLHLNTVAPVEAPPAPEAKVTPPKPKPRTPPHHAGSREFHMPEPDGRPVMVVRNSVQFFLPLKDDPETKILLGLRGAKGAMPLAISYAEFKAWWEA